MYKQLYKYTFKCISMQKNKNSTLNRGKKQILSTTSIRQTMISRIDAYCMSGRLPWLSARLLLKPFWDPVQARGFSLSGDGVAVRGPAQGLGEIDRGR